MDIEQEYFSEFQILKEEGGLTGSWTNIYDHCKLEGVVAVILSNLLNLDTDDTKTLVKAAILHDWYKRNEIENARKYDTVTAYENSEQESFNKLVALGINKRIVEVAHSVGAFSLKDIIPSQDLLKRIMHYIDDICLHDKIVEVSERMKYNKEKYPNLDQEGRKEFNGNTYSEIQEQVGIQIQNEIESMLSLPSNSLVPIIRQQYELLYKKV